MARSLQSDRQEAVEERSVASHRLPQSSVETRRRGPTATRVSERSLAKTPARRFIVSATSLSGPPCTAGRGSSTKPRSATSIQRRAELQRLLGREEGRRRLDVRRLPREGFCSSLFSGSSGAPGDGAVFARSRPSPRLEPLCLNHVSPPQSSRKLGSSSKEGARSGRTLPAGPRGGLARFLFSAIVCAARSLRMRCGWSTETSASLLEAPNG